jgi:hypothetical protein
MNEKSVKILVVDGPDTGKIHKLNILKNEIRIGRSDSTKKRNIPDLNLESDSRISQHHARLVRINEKWFIVDLGSDLGTTVDGREIQGHGSIELAPIVPVVTGETIWTIVPNNCIHSQLGQVFIFVPYIDTINYALYHCGKPAVGKPIVRNYGEKKSDPFNFRLQISGFSDPCIIEVPPLEPNQSMQLEIPIMPLYTHILRNQIESVRTHLKLEIIKQPDISALTEVTILGFWDWSYEQNARRTIAAFVLPRNPVIEYIVSKAQLRLKEDEGINNFRSLLRSGKKNSEKLILKILYDYLKDNTDMLFEDPKIVSDSKKVTTYQTIKAPHHIFSKQISSLSAKAKCIDLALLFAACLENIGLYPVVIITGDKVDIPSHALIGCWTVPAPNCVPILHLDKLRTESESGNLIALECLGIIETMNPDNKKLDFLSAKDSAVKKLNTTKWAYAVDIVSLRPPYSSIVPLDNPIEPEVDGAIEIAKSFAELKKLHCVETTHLFFGLIMKNGKVIKWLLEEAGIDIFILRNKIETSIIPHQAPKAAVFTQNFIDCRHMAEEFARQVGSPSVQEQHLLWALLDKACVQGSFQDTCQKLKIDVEKLRQLLNKRYPRPKVTYSLSSLSINLK